MRKLEKMAWAEALPNPLAGDAATLACQPMEDQVFAEFYERTARSLWAYLARVCGDGSLADDLTQESYVRLLVARTAFGNEDEARRYLFRIGTNLLRDHWRRPRLLNLDENSLEQHASGNLAEDTERKVLMEPALKMLKPRERQLLWLAYAEGYDHREIAQITGLSSTSIRLLLFRARRHMAREMRSGETRKEVEG